MAGMARALGSGMAGSCADQAQLLEAALALEFWLAILPCHGGMSLLRVLFGPLGHEFDARQLDLDERCPTWGTSAYLNVKLKKSLALHLTLTRLYVLIPTLDSGKPYWAGEDKGTS